MSDEQAEEFEKIAAETRKQARKGYLPEQWENSYGLPVVEHKTALQVDIREGYAQYDMFLDKKPEEGSTNAVDQ